MPQSTDSSCLSIPDSETYETVANQHAALAVQHPYLMVIPIFLSKARPLSLRSYVSDQGI